MKRLAFCAFSGWLVCSVACATAWAQASAQITGTVKDPTGAVLPGVEITATQTDTENTRTTVTNETGYYILQNLPTGPAVPTSRIDGRMWPTAPPTGGTSSIPPPSLKCLDSRTRSRTGYLAAGEFRIFIGDPPAASSM